jgi:UDP-N-acetylglucosamine 2-epimerase (non-hydrolysing)
MLSWVFEGVKPERIVVQGDTATAFAASLYAFHNHVGLAHIEAGLRTWDKNSPWPEEVYRQFISSVADIHFAPTTQSAYNLDLMTFDGRSITAENIYVTGNPVVDSVHQMAPKPTLSNNVLVTLHRREAPVKTYSRALYELIKRNLDYNFRIIVHPNPTGQELEERLRCVKAMPNVQFLAPLDYHYFLKELASCYMVITDSGGLQEEAATLHKPAVILRDVTERPEAVECGAAVLAGDSVVKIADMVERILNDPTVHQNMHLAGNPFGDGHAGERIAKILNGR